MLQSLGDKPGKLSALKPQRLLAGIRYRLRGLRVPAQPFPDHVALGMAPHDEAFRHLSFTFAIIALSARIACAGEPLSRGKYIAFREAFPLKGQQCGKIRALFALACDNPTPFEHYVTQIKYAFPGQTQLFVSLIDRLFSIAAANGEICRDSERMLAHMANMLELSPAVYTRIAARYRSGTNASHVLGVSAGVSQKAVKKRYHELMRNWHPDRFAGEKLSPEVELIVRLKTAQINEAYRALSRRAA